MGTFWVIETARETYWDVHQTGEAVNFTESLDAAVKFWDFSSAEIVRSWLLERTGAPRLRSRIICKPILEERHA